MSHGGRAGVADPQRSASTGGGESADRLPVRLSDHLAGNVLRGRMRRGWTQETLAAVSGVSVRRVQGIEAGRANATLSTVEALAGALGVDPLVLLREPRR